MKKYPPVNYIGNKLKLSTWIISNLPITNGTILDLFSGGGSIAYSFKKKGYRVLTNDSLYSSYILNKALIENQNITLNSEHIHNAQKMVDNPEVLEKIEPLKNNLYYPSEIIELSKLIDYSNQLKGYKKVLFLSLLRRAMIRKLPYSRMNIDWKNIQKLRDEEYSYQKYGRKRAYHNKSFSYHMTNDLPNYNNAIFSNGLKNKSYQKDSLKLLKEIPHNLVDLVYIDPPYPGTMNNYWDFYGTFDDIFDKKINFTDFTNKKSFLNEIHKIIDYSARKTKYAIFSLNSNSNPNIDELEVIGKFYGRTKIFERKHNYQISGKEMKNKNYEQILLIDFYR